MLFMFDSKLLVGIMMIAMNVGSRHVVAELTPAQEKAMASTVAKRFVLFAIFYVAVRDLACAAALTCIFTICISTLFNENSKFFLLSDE